LFGQDSSHGSFSGAESNTALQLQPQTSRSTQSCAVLQPEDASTGGVGFEDEFETAGSDPPQPPTKIAITRARMVEL
jgi:hypothetical protein